MEAFLPADDAPAAAGARAGVLPARICLRSALGSFLIQCTVSMLAFPNNALTLLVLCECVAAFKRPRFKKVGMKRAKKAKPAVAQAEQLMQSRIAAVGGGQAPDPAPLPLHTGVAAAPAHTDKLQQQLEAAQSVVYEANLYDDMCQKELVKAEKQRDINMRIYYARLERWARESRSKKPPRPSLVLKRVDKNTAFEHESVLHVMAVRYVAMEARAELAEAVGKADDARILILKRRVRQLLKCQKSQPRARKARAEK